MVQANALASEILQKKLASTAAGAGTSTFAAGDEDDMPATQMSDADYRKLLERQRKKLMDGEDSDSSSSNISVFDPFMSKCEGRQYRAHAERSASPRLHTPTRRCRLPAFAFDASPSPTGDCLLTVSVCNCIAGESDERRRRSGRTGSARRRKGRRRGRRRRKRRRRKRRRSVRARMRPHSARSGESDVRRGVAGAAAATRPISGVYHHAPRRRRRSGIVISTRRNGTRTSVSVSALKATTATPTQRGAPLLPSPSPGCPRGWATHVRDRR